MKQTNFRTIFLMAALTLIILLASCKTDGKIIKPGENIDVKIAEFESSQQLKKFSSTQEISEFLKKIQSQSGATDYYGGARSLGVSASMAESAAPQSKSADSGTAASDYSQTNIQVEGVDEADFVKNDNKYIYMISQKKLVIVNAYPAEDAKILSTTKIDGNPRDLFVNKDRLVLFVDGNDQTPVFEQYDFVPRPRYVSKTHAYVYDISDREEPKLVKDYNLKGNYYQSRMIGDYVYFISTDYAYYYGNVVDMPVIKQGSDIVTRPEIYYFDNPETNYNFNTVAAFNVIEDDGKINAKTFMMGYTNTLYVSQDNIYITYQKNLPYTYYEKHNEDRFYDVVVPLLPSETKSRINSIKNDDSLNSYEKWDRISNALEEMYNKMEEDDKEELVEKIAIEIEDYEARLEVERRKTVIHKIGINEGEIEYGTRGEVPGYLLNQFSMDENGKYFRVATTFEFYGGGIMPMWRGGMETSVAVAEAEQVSGSGSAPSGISKEEDEKIASTSLIAPRIPRREFVMYNNVYVLDEKLQIVGKLEALAPDERIYSTRFLGDRLYMVTFKRVDPLFVIDLSDPQNPEVLGELKIPGFSDYLHPYDEDHIIGIGKETEGNEWGGISTKGVKIALFDVSDVKNPKELDKYEIGDSGTDSEALRDHKAFLFNKNKNLLVLPVTEVKGKLEYDSKLGYYRQRYWQGAYVFSIERSVSEWGFIPKGRISHNEGDENRDWYWYGSPNSVRRSLFMDDVLYTVSGIKIKANDLNDISKEIKEVKLPYETNQYDYPVYYQTRIGVAEAGTGAPNEGME